MSQFVGWTNFKATPAYGNVWRLIPTTADRCITGTGANVDTPITIDKKHRLVAIEIALMDSAYALSDDYAFSIQLRRDQGQVEDSQYHHSLLWDNGHCGFKSQRKEFGTGKEYESTKWTIRTFQSTGRKASIVLYVQVDT